MRYSSVIVAVSALAGFAVAQNNTVIPCCSVPVNNVPEDTRDSWCAAQENTCIDLCGGDPSDIGSNGNTCESDTLDYTCKCANGTEVSDTTMALYEQTVPSQMCYFWFDACINATIGTNGEGDRAEQTACREARASRCGTLTFDESDNDTDSSSTSTASATGSQASATGSQASSTASSTAAASSGAAIANIALGTPALAGGLLAIFGLAL